MQEDLQKLISFKTVSGNFAENNQALNFIEQRLAANGLHIERFDFNNFGALIATTRPTKTPTVFFAAHLDVVPGDDSLFVLHQDEVNYYGRGVYDMKSAIALYLWLTDHLKDKLSDYDFGIMITTDEEVGGNNGVAKLVEAGYLPRVTILPDGGDNWQIEARAKGILGIELSVPGKTAHGSRPWEGENAADKLLAMVQEITALAPMPYQQEGTTLTISRLSAGAAINQVPDLATVGLDFRFGSTQDQVQICEEVYAIAKKYDATPTMVVEGATVEVDLSNEFVTAFIEQAGAISGRTITSRLSFGASDARFFAAKGVPCVVMQSIGGGRHAPDEWVDKKDLEQFGQTLLAFTNVVAHRP